MSNRVAQVTIGLLSIVVIALVILLWRAERPVVVTETTVQAVEKLDLALARNKIDNSCKANNLQPLFPIETLGEIRLESLPPDQRILIEQVAWRLAGADSAYNAMFTGPYVNYSDSTIVRAAADSTIPHDSGPAAEVLETINAALPSIYRRCQS